MTKQCQTLIDKMDRWIKKGMKIPKSLKWLRRSIFHLFNLFYKPLYLNYYSGKINSLPKMTQLFFVARNDLGTHLYLIHYVKLWEENRGPACIVPLTSDWQQVQQLAHEITPKTPVIVPEKLWQLISFMLFGSTMIHWFCFSYIYPFLANARPDALNLFYLFGNGITEYNCFLDHALVQHGPKYSNDFIKAYMAVRNQFDYRWDIYQDYYQLNNKSTHQKLTINSNLFGELNISEPYVVMNINCKDYIDSNSNRRTVYYPLRYLCVIDALIDKGYDVVIQGRDEQPQLPAKRGLHDYARSPHTSLKNDLYLYKNAEFAITSKSGIEAMAAICNTPVLGLNYTEILGLQPAKKMRFFPKYIQHVSTGHILSWKEHIQSPCFFEIGENNYSENEYRYLDMSEKDMLSALHEFLPLLDLPDEKWTQYTSHQVSFKGAICSLHQELFLVQAVPSDIYLITSENKALQSTLI